MYPVTIRVWKSSRQNRNARPCGSVVWFSGLYLSGRNTASQILLLETRLPAPLWKLRGSNCPGYQASVQWGVPFRKEGQLVVLEVEVLEFGAEVPKLLRERGQLARPHLHKLKQKSNPIKNQTHPRRSEGEVGRDVLALAARLAPTPENNQESPPHDYRATTAAKPQPATQDPCTRPAPHI